jgi:pimeloyl-ACP methyl ester carboxylesterase
MEQPVLAEPQRGHLIRANGLDIYYEEHGRGIPLLLIHGGTINGACWRPYLAAFSAHYRVIVPDSRGHGRTVNPLDTMSYRLLADDMVALAEELGLHRPLIVGYSDGGQVALEIGMRYPDLPQALVVGAAWFRFSETYRTLIRHIFGDEHLPDVDIERFARENPEWAEELQTLHGPGRWKGLLRQIKDLWSTPLNYISDDFARVVAPTRSSAGSVKVTRK